MNLSLFNSLKWPIGAILLFLILNVVYFAPQLSGKKMSMGDIEQHKAMSKEAIDYQEETGNVALWTNGMFSGMPTYQISASQSNNLLLQVNKAMHLFITRPIGYFFAAMLCFYVMMLALGASHGTAIIGAIAFGLTTNNMVLFVTGHTSKMMAVVYMPLIIAGMVLAFKQRLFLGGALFALGMGLDILVNHYQMTYYLAILLAIYGLIQLGIHIRDKKLPQFGKAAGVLIIGLLLAAGSAAVKLWPTYEYGQDTMRGKPILAQKSSTEAASSSETKGLAWNYAMAWSAGVGDLVGTIIPRAVGGSSREVVKNSKTVRELKKRAPNLQSHFPIPLYYGAIGSTSGPYYYGAVIMFLFILSFFVSKGPLKWWLVAATALTMIMSLGLNAKGINQFLFDNLPLLNKFRAPSSILSVTAMLATLLGTLALKDFLQSKKDLKILGKNVIMAAGITTGFCLLVILLGSSFTDFSGVSDASYANAGYDINALKDDRSSALTGDAIRSIIFILLAGAALWSYTKGFIKKPILLLAMGSLVTIDGWTIANRYISHDSFVAAKNLDQSYQARPVDIQINADPDLHYRVHDLTTDPFKSSKASFFHKTIGGYHAAKLQRYQDVIERYISRGNMPILNMLNTKYIIQNGANGEPAKTSRNPGAMGNAWFVEDFKFVSTAQYEITDIGTVDLANVAVVHEEFKPLLEGFEPVKSGTIQLTNYTPNKITYKSNSQTDQFAVFSEVWYGPNKGWKIKVDGSEVPLIRTNYVLRGAQIPAGDHTIEMEFNPRSYRTGGMISLLCSLMIILGIFYSFFMAYRGGQIFTSAEPATNVNVKIKSKKSRSSGKTKSKSKK